MFTLLTRLHWDQGLTRRSTISSLFPLVCVCVGGVAVGFDTPKRVYVLTVSPVTPGKKAAGGKRI